MSSKDRKTAVKSVAFNNYLLERTEKLVDADRFGSVSDVVITALTEFLLKNELERENIDTLELLVVLSKNEECRLEIDRILSLEKEKSVKPKYSKHPMKIVEDLTIEDEGSEF